MSADSTGTPDHSPPMFVVISGYDVHHCDTPEEARDRAREEAQHNPGTFVNIYQHAGAMRFRDETPEAANDANG